MTVRVEKCPDCDERVAIPDNKVRLSFPAEPFQDDPLGACWTITNFGPVDMAGVGGHENPPALGHRLHEHQPPES